VCLFVNLALWEEFPYSGSPALHNAGAYRLQIVGAGRRHSSHRQPTTLGPPWAYYKQTISGGFLTLCDYGVVKEEAGRRHD